MTVLEQKDPDGVKVFKIGHSRTESQTFIPDVVPFISGSTDFVFIDIAGLNDTGGNLIELVNCFITKQIFKAAKQVKILLLLTKAQISCTQINSKYGSPSSARSTAVY